MSRQDYLEAQADYMQENAAEMREEAKRTCWRCKQQWYFKQKGEGSYEYDYEVGHKKSCVYFETSDRFAADLFEDAPEPVIKRTGMLDLTQEELMNELSRGPWTKEDRERLKKRARQE